VSVQQAAGRAGVEHPSRTGSVRRDGTGMDDLAELTVERGESFPVPSRSLASRGRSPRARAVA